MFTPHERDKLLLAVAAMVARDRLGRGIKLNYPEANAMIATQIMEWAREGRSLPDIVELGPTILSADEVMSGVAEMIPSVQVEATFPDGTKLVTLHHPIQ
ncbi:MAG: urease subunit gamma [Spirochaetaceae bacterium]|nr:urease subunit gamma [Spirochaetaceae bacterium]